jgi:RNA polymerase sigma-70 factor (ECF subfamily)
MSEPPADFAALVDRARKGDQDALAQLARQYEPKVRVVARVLLGPALRPYLDSVDLVQSVHRSLVVGLRQAKFTFAGPENLVALALTMVRRKVARHWRRLQRQQRLSHGPPANRDLPGLLTSLSSPQSGPAQAAQFKDQVRQLWDQLDAGERRLLEMRLGGHSPAEIAAELGLNPIALRVRMTRLRRRLKANGILDDWL